MRSTGCGSVPKPSHSWQLPKFYATLCEYGHAARISTDLSPSATAHYTHGCVLRATANLALHSNPSPFQVDAEIDPIRRVMDGVMFRC